MDEAEITIADSSGAYLKNVRSEFAAYSVLDRQPLFRLDPSDAQRSLEDARVSLRRALAELAQARANTEVAVAESADADAARADMSR